MKNFGYLLAVEDIHKARSFYEDLFGLTVISDYGINISFDCGLSLQQNFDWLTGIPKEEMKNKENNCELYFEEKEFDKFIEKLKMCEDIILLHDVLEQTWGQRTIRFYDLDNHLIEVGESMKSVVQNFLSQGMTFENIAVKMDISRNDIDSILKTEE